MCELILTRLKISNIMAAALKPPIFFIECVFNTTSWLEFYDEIYVQTFLESLVSPSQPNPGVELLSRPPGVWFQLISTKTTGRALISCLARFERNNVSRNQYNAIMAGLILSRKISRIATCSNHCLWSQTC